MQTAPHGQDRRREGFLPSSGKSERTHAQRVIGMTLESPDDPRDAWQSQHAKVIVQFGADLRALHDTNPWPNQPVLPEAINTLMTELWDNGFSQTEIREAFEAAVADMPRYAAGDEVRR